MEGLRVTDPTTGEVLDLAIPAAVYAASVHGRLPCTECHPTGYEGRLPHRGPRSYPRYLCVDCHADDDGVEQFRLPLRRDHLRASVHGKTAKRPLDCHDCHDPHRFAPVRELGAALDRIALSNRLCLGCHGPAGGRSHGYADLPVAEQSHDRFPNPAAHFRKIKCVACHTPLDSPTRHDVQPARLAVRECADCHARGSARLRTSYALSGPSRPGEHGHRPGDRVPDNAYVVGSTRSETLDLVSLAGAALVLGLVLLHACARAFQARRRKRT